MMLPQVSSELERMWLCGRSVWQTTLGLRGSDTSTAVKFFGALSCASQMMRRPSGAICTDMPSPMPPKPSSMWWESSLKFHVTVPSALAWPGLLVPRLTAGFLTDDFFAVFFALLAFIGLSSWQPAWTSSQPSSWHASFVLSLRRSDRVGATFSAFHRARGGAWSAGRLLG